MATATGKAPDGKAPAAWRPDKASVAQWELVGDALRYGDRVLLYGPPGTGKSTAGVAESRRAGQRLVKVTLTRNTPAAELRGHWVPAGDGWTWHHGPVIRAWLDGSLLLVDEIDRADEDAHAFLLAALDDRSVARLTLPSGEDVVPADGFRVVATMNGEPADLDAALADRFSVRVEVTYPHPDGIRALSAPLRKLAARTAASVDPLEHIGLRAWRAFDDLTAAGMVPERAASVVFGGERRGLAVLRSVEVGRLVPSALAGREGAGEV